MFKFLRDENEGQQQCGESRSMRPATEVNVKNIHYEISETVGYAKQRFINFETKYILIKELGAFLKNEDRVREILESSSDLVSGAYEGGFKIWECTVDLIKYLETHETRITLKSKVLDLGCGSGLLGLYALSKGADVDFQDYNSEVVDYLTIPNVIINNSDNDLLRCRFYSGDWGTLEGLFKEHQSQHQYEFILSAETIYNLDYLPNFLRVVKSCLKPGGSLYLAAKTYYFGVGGGTNAFQNLILQDPSLKSEVAHVIREGVQREIIKVTRIT